jgi:hypothetical protein
MPTDAADLYSQEKTGRNRRAVKGRFWTDSEHGRALCSVSGTSLNV